ncbi:ankyrin-1-like [Trichogramma pretiosum]|uniref:ankyrin-1-like n=1 Tax=Trichogramma pretiosum TaxID=7493 RepID=UPI000C719472|nr:ankyrin-1-like [Trichogramma pretiosum]
MGWSVEERREFLFRIELLIHKWRGPLPELDNLFDPKEIECLLNDSIHSIVDKTTFERAKEFVQFVIKTEHMDEPELDEEGMPWLHRTTPIHSAANNNYEDIHVIIEELFKMYNSYDVNYIDEYGYTHFHVACKFGLDEIVERFLEFKPNPIHTVSETDDSPLELALENGHKKVAERLLRNGADPNLANRWGFTPLHILNKRHGNSDLVKMFFDVNDELNQTLRVDALNDLGEAPLHLALFYGNLTMFRLLLEHDADPNLSNGEASTPLHLISLYGHYCLGEILFRINERKYREGKTSLVRVDAQNEYDNTALHYALRRGKKDIARLLLRNGADPNLANREGLTPLRIIINFHEDYSADLANILLNTSKEVNRLVQVDEPDRSGNIPLYYALQRGNIHMIRWLLKNGACPVEVNKPDRSGNTLLHYALQRGNVWIIEELLRSGAGPNSANKTSLTPLHFIINFNDSNSEKLANILLEASGRPLQVDKPDQWGNTPLHHASQRGNVSMMKWLLRNGADPNLTNQRGLTSLHVIIHSHKHRSDYLAKILLNTSKQLGLEVEAKIKPLQVQVDKPDHSGNTPLTLAVGKLYPRLVDVLLDNGADCSRLIIPSEIMPEYHKWKKNFKLILVSGIIAVVERLQNRGLQFNESSFLIYYTTAVIKYGPSETSANVQESWYDDEEFAEGAKKIMMKPNLSLYDLIRLPSDEAQRQLKSTDYLEFARSKKWGKLPIGPLGRSLWEICAEHLCKNIPRARYFLDWQLAAFD